MSKAEQEERYKNVSRRKVLAGFLAGTAGLTMAAYAGGEKRTAAQPLRTLNSISKETETPTMQAITILTPRSKDFDPKNPKWIFKKITASASSPQVLNPSQVSSVDATVPTPTFTPIETATPTPTPSPEPTPTPIYAQQCANIHLPGHPEISLKNPDNRGVVITFSDQLQGQQDAQNGILQSLYMQDPNLQETSDFYNKYTGELFSRSMNSGSIMAPNTWSYYLGSGPASFFSDMKKIINPSLFIDNGNAVVAVYVAAVDHTGIYITPESTGNFDGTYGEMLITTADLINGWTYVSAFYEKQSEGIATGMQWNYNDQISIMYPWWTPLDNPTLGEERIIDTSDIQIICGSPNTVTPTPTQMLSTPTFTPAPVRTPTPTPRPTLTPTPARETVTPTPTPRPTAKAMHGIFLPFVQK